VNREGEQLGIHLLAVERIEDPGRYRLTLDIQGEHVSTVIDLGDIVTLEQAKACPRFDCNDIHFHQFLFRHRWLHGALHHVLLAWDNGRPFYLPHRLLPPESQATIEAFRIDLVVRGEWRSTFVSEAFDDTAFDQIKRMATGWPTGVPVNVSLSRVTMSRDEYDAWPNVHDSLYAPIRPNDPGGG
jgi:hypothetical protein